MLIDDITRSPILNMTTTNLFGLKADGTPGEILVLWDRLRKQVGVIEREKKPGMKFEVRTAETTIGEVRKAANELGILIYPHEARGAGYPVEDGSLATVTVSIICQAISDGSCLCIAGFGLGADSQDKAGGKAGTYAFKQALLQAMLANGADTDDDHEPIKGGVRPPVKKYTKESVEAELDACTTAAQYNQARAHLLFLPRADIAALKERALQIKGLVGA